MSTWQELVAMSRVLEAMAIKLGGSSQITKMLLEHCK